MTSSSGSCRWETCGILLAMTGFHAALVDWRGTLVHITPPSSVVRQALQSLGRGPDARIVDMTLARLRAELESPASIAAERVIDSSTTVHRTLSLDMFDRAGIDDELAVALYEAEWDPASRPVYPDAVATLAALKAGGVKTAIVSDIHFDIRPECHERQMGRYVDAYVLSCEQGFQKPDPRMFALALDALGMEGSEALMIGDTPHTDGGAAEMGIATLILPRPEDFGPRGLDIVPSLFGLSPGNPH